MIRLFHFFRRKNYPHRAYPLLAAGLTQVFAVFTFMLAARWLVPAELGTWAMFLTLVSFIEMARLGLVQSAVVHFSAHCLAEERSFLQVSALIIGLVASVIGAILLGVLGSVINLLWHLPGLVDLFVWFPVVALLTAPLRWHDAVRTAAQDFRGIFLAAFYYGFSYLIFLLLAKYYLGEMKPLYLLGLQIPAALLTIILRKKTLLAGLAFEKGKFERERLGYWSRKIWNYGRFGLGSNLFSMLFQRADVLLLGAFVTPAGLAVYNVATRISTWLDFPLNALSQAFFPKIATENVRNGESGVAILYQKSVKTLLLYGLPLSIGAFFGADLLVRFLAGGAFPGAANLLRILLLANLAKPFGRMLGIVLDATGRPAINFRMVVLSLGLNLILLLCLLPTFGTTGAAVAGTLGIFLTTAAGQWYYRSQKWGTFAMQ